MFFIVILERYAWQLEYFCVCACMCVYPSICLSVVCMQWIEQLVKDSVLQLKKEMLFPRNGSERLEKGEWNEMKEWKRAWGKGRRERRWTEERNGVRNRIGQVFLTLGWWWLFMLVWRVWKAHVKWQAVQWVCLFTSSLSFTTLGVYSLETD